MPISPNEIKSRAKKFSKDWEGQGYEKGQTQLFYQDFFNIFDVPIKRVASFEAAVKTSDLRERGYIDLFWKGKLLVEQKSMGQDLIKAKDQAYKYFPYLSDKELPRYILLSDFQSFELYDLETQSELKFPLKDLHKHIQKFGFINGVEKKEFKDESPINIRAAELMGLLYDALRESGYSGHDLERFLVRIVFCLFADDTGIFHPRGIFEEFISKRTNVDGSDLGLWLSQIFQTLDTPVENRNRNLDDDLQTFPYINGELFQDRLELPAFNSLMRDRLLDACMFDWSEISPAIFGSMFQSIMDVNKRRELGAHYTSEKNIIKVIQPLFLDDLWSDFKHLKERKDNRRKNDLKKFQKHLSNLKFLDPACGCGNFLLVAYREIRLIEMEVIKELIDYERNPFGEYQAPLDAGDLSLVNVDQFYGIEIGEFAARIAEISLWMMDHLMNNKLSLEFGPYYSRIPLRRSPNIVVGNALEIDWKDVLDPLKCSYVFGNPPFRGSSYRTKEQKEEVKKIWEGVKKSGLLDYVTCWFKKGVEYSLSNKNMGIAFVSTNTITQGEQCGVLWPHLFKYGIRIQFAHKSFEWESEARGKAHVHCVIIGMTGNDKKECSLYSYKNPKSDYEVSKVSRLNGYLVEGTSQEISFRSRTPKGRLKMHEGSNPRDAARRKNPAGGHYPKTSNLILDKEHYDELLEKEPEIEKWIKPFVGSRELISGIWRWCLWLKNANVNEIRNSEAIQERLDRIRLGRSESSRKQTKDFVKYPTLFVDDMQPTETYLAVPVVSSEKREYIPLSFLPPSVVASGSLRIIPKAPLHYFGILTSTMHMAWMRTVGGRMKSDYSYSTGVYNSFPWPEMDDSKKEKISILSQQILDARKAEDATLEALYDPLNMPPILRKAHEVLDKAVDRLYRKKPFQDEEDRLKHLFNLYEERNPSETDKPVSAKRIE